MAAPERAPDDVWAAAQAAAPRDALASVVHVPPTVDDDEPRRKLFLFLLHSRRRAAAAVTAIECDDAVKLAANPTALLQLRLVASNALAAVAGMGLSEAR